MPTIYEIIAELNESNSTNYKLEVLKKYKDHELFQKVLKMTYDSVAYTYGVSLKNIQNFDPVITGPVPFESSLDIIAKKVASRKVTGHAALQLVSNLIGNSGFEDADVLKKIINRDLRINVGKTQINKVWPGLLTKTVYMRCGTFSEKLAKHITFPAGVQLKADGTYREFTVDSGKISSRSRSGEDYDYPVLYTQMLNAEYPDGVYCGELTVLLSSSNVEKLKAENPVYAKTIQEAYDAGHRVLPRALSNGMINSDNPPHDDIILDLWDYITLEEYTRAGLRDKKNQNTTKYSDRLNALENIVIASSNIQIIEGRLVNSLKEALQYTSEWMNGGFEGSILKDLGGVFKDGTSKHQLKLKLKIDCEMRITGFADGTPGTKREGKVGALLFENDEGTIKGRTSGFSDAQLDDFTNNPEKYLGKVMTVQFNDLSKAEGNSYYALSHPRFIEVRNDKDETDTLEKVLELREMAMSLS